MTDDKFLQGQTKEQLIVFIHNNEYTINNLRNRLLKLTGCADFGNVDGMNGICVDCSYSDQELFNKCWQFRFSPVPVDRPPVK